MLQISIENKLYHYREFSCRQYMKKKLKSFFTFAVEKRRKLILADL